MGSQTIVSVPSWAFSSVGQYINQAWNVSQGNGDIPSVVITSGYGANAYAVISGGVVTSINVTNGGQWYSEAPTVVILPSDSTGADATAVATVAANIVTNIAVTNGGTGYTVPPIVMLIPNGAGASASAVVVGDLVDSITLDNGGSNYTALPYVEVIGGNGVGALASAVLTATSIDHILVTNGGSGYTSPPDVAFDPAGATGTAHLTGDIVTSIDVDTGGMYTTVPTISFSGGAGSDAEAEAHMVGVPIYSVTVDNKGSGYTTSPYDLDAYSGDIIATQPINEENGRSALISRSVYGNATIDAAYTFVDGMINGGKLTGLTAGLLSKISTKEIAAFAEISALIGDKALYVGDPDTTLLAQTLVVTTPATYIARLNAQIEYDNYEEERFAMDTALGLGIDLGKQSALDAENLRKGGLYLREYYQTTYELAHKLYIEQEEINVYRLEILGNALRAITGSQQASSGNDSGPSSLMQAVGVVSAGVGLYNALNAAGVFATTATSVVEGASAAEGMMMVAGSMVAA